MDLVRIGLVRRAHGVRGEVVVEGPSLSASELRKIGVFTWRGPDGAQRELSLESLRPAHDRLLVRFRGVGDRDQAAALGGGELLADRASVPDAGPGQAYTYEIVGLKVVEENGREIGTVADVLRTGAHPVYVVRGAREILIPAVEPILRRVDLAAGTIVVALPAGLEEL